MAGKVQKVFIKAYDVIDGESRHGKYLDRGKRREYQRNWFKRNWSRIKLSRLSKKEQVFEYR